ncbi:MAG: HAD family hydrolase [Elusimicrobiota bacterium]|jgi:phosphoglycolate phosphatase-like HAD superfamily hydrolase|nr:HAD family hydrolase [Elusimicrobiota bacterium]
MKQNEAIIFDLDGTLADTLNVSVKATRELLQNLFGLKLDDTQVAAHFGKSEDALFKHFCGADWQKAMDAYADFFAKNVTAGTLFPRIKDILDYLKLNNIKTAVVTGRSAQSAEQILKAAGIRDYFDFVKPGSSEGSIKPRCIKEVLAAWGQAPRGAYYIGDIPNDIIDAKAAGVNALSASWADWVDKPAQQACAPLHIFHTTQEFEDWIKMS